MDWKNVGIVAVAMGVVQLLVHTVESFLTMGYYTDPVYVQVWGKVMMPSLAAPPPMSFFVLSFVFGIIAWGMFAFAYGKLGLAIKQKDMMKKGLKFGALVFLVGGVPMTLTLYLLVNLPAMLIAIWAVTGLILDLIGGVLAAKMIKQE